MKKTALFSFLFFMLLARPFLLEGASSSVSRASSQVCESIAADSNAKFLEIEKSYKAGIVKVKKSLRNLRTILKIIVVNLIVICLIAIGPRYLGKLLLLTARILRKKAFIFPLLIPLLGMGIGLWILKNPREKFDIGNFSTLLGTLKRGKVELSSEDSPRMDRYKKRYQENYTALLKPSTCEQKIPKVIHWIWVGPNPFPKKSVKNIVSWKMLHPDWTFKFWTDSHEAPFAGLERHLIEEIDSDWLRPLLQTSENYGEMSDLIRYAILDKEGGLYIDHDVECFQSFDALHSQVSFYASLEPPHPTPVSKSQLIVTNCLICVKAHHDVIRRTIELVQDKWDTYEKKFPGKDRSSNVMRTLFRTFSPFGEAVDEKIDNDSVLLPAPFIFPDRYPEELLLEIQKHKLNLASHAWDHSWLNELPTTSGEMVTDFNNQIERLSNRCAKLSRSIYIYLSLSFAVLLWILFRSLKRPRSSQ